MPRRAEPDSYGSQIKETGIYAGLGVDDHEVFFVE